jgi:hypothetical protein
MAVRHMKQSVSSGVNSSTGLVFSLRINFTVMSVCQVPWQLLHRRWSMPAAHWAVLGRILKHGRHGFVPGWCKTDITNWPSHNADAQCRGWVGIVGGVGPAPQTTRISD